MPVECAGDLLFPDVRSDELDADGTRWWPFSGMLCELVLSWSIRYVLSGLYLLLDLA